MSGHTTGQRNMSENIEILKKPMMNEFYKSVSVFKTPNY